MELKVTDQEIKIIDSSIVVSGSVNLYKAQFRFDESWIGFTKTAIFKRLNHEPFAVLLDDFDSCAVPYKVLEKSGYINVGVFGVKDCIRKPTIWTPSIWVDEGCVMGRVVPDPDPTIYEQILKQLAAIKQEISRIETPEWLQVRNKPFVSIGEGLQVDENGVLSATGGGGTGEWDDIKNKPFSTIDSNTLKVQNGKLMVNTTNDMEEDNTQPITSAGVQVVVGNINSILTTI